MKEGNNMKTFELTFGEVLELDDMGSFITEKGIIIYYDYNGHYNYAKKTKDGLLGKSYRCCIKGLW